MCSNLSELAKLMHARVHEFSDCVEARAQDASLEFVEIDVSLIYLNVISTFLGT
jgi:hypothetical protein